MLLPIIIQVLAEKRGVRGEERIVVAKIAETAAACGGNGVIVLGVRRPGDKQRRHQERGFG